MSQDGDRNGSVDDVSTYYDEESLTTPQTDSRSVSIDDIPTYFYYHPNELAASRLRTPDEPPPRFPRDRRFGSYNNRRAHLYTPDIGY